MKPPEQRVEALERRAEDFGEAGARTVTAVQELTARVAALEHLGQLDLRAVIDQVVVVIREHATPETIPAIAPALRELAPALHTGTLCGPCVATVTPPERGKPCQWCGVQGDGEPSPENADAGAKAGRAHRFPFGGVPPGNPSPPPEAHIGHMKTYDVYAQRVQWTKIGTVQAEDQQAAFDAADDVEDPDPGDTEWTGIRRVSERSGDSREVVT